MESLEKTLKKAIGQENTVLIVKGSNVEILEAPPSGFGEQIITWLDGKPTHVKYQFTKKL